MSNGFTLVDEAGDALCVFPADELRANTACVIARHATDIPAHRLAEVVGAMYKAAGQDVPPLPDIPEPVDEAQAVELGSLIGKLAANTGLDASQLFVRDLHKIAEGILREGYAKPEPTP